MLAIHLHKCELLQHPMVTPQNMKSQVYFTFREKTVGSMVQESSNPVFNEFLSLEGFVGNSNDLKVEIWTPKKKDFFGTCTVILKTNEKSGKKTLECYLRRSIDANAKISFDLEWHDLILEGEQSLEPLTPTPLPSENFDIFLLDSDSHKDDLVFGTYKIVKEIGQGGQARVYLCNKGGHIYALKKIYCRTKGAVNDAINEVIPIMRWKHENLVPYIDVEFEDYGNDENTEAKYAMFFITPYYSLGDLEMYIRKRKQSKIPFSENIIRSYLIQLCSGLNFVHQHNFIHRDLKPGNIFLLDNHKKVVIGDFGLLKAFKDLNSERTAGTPKYMAPEVADGSFTTHKCDCWSLGCLLYYMMTLEYNSVFYIDAMKDKNFHQNLRKKLLPTGYSELLIDMCISLLQIDAGVRMSCFEVIQTLDPSFVEEEQPSIKPKMIASPALHKVIADQEEREYLQARFYLIIAVVISIFLMVSMPLLLSVPYVFISLKYNDSRNHRVKSIAKYAKLLFVVALFVTFGLIVFVALPITVLLILSATKVV